jgi:DNA polymerase-3 subunit beta
MIHSVYYAVDLNDSRKVLHGISLSVKDGKLSMAATDGKRLALVEDQAVESSGDGDVILPLRTAQELQRLLGQEGTAEIELSDAGIQVRLGDTQIFSKLIEGNYLNYRPIIPAESTMELSVPCNDVRQSLMLLAMPLAAKSANIKLSFRQNELEFFLRNDNTGEGKDLVKVDYDQDEAIEMTINLQFLLDPFKNLEDLTFRFKINDSVSPVMLENDKGFRYIIMPILVQ